MKVLVLSNTPWADNNSFGSSFSNIFRGISDIQFANIYCLEGQPDNQWDMRFFRITEKTLLRNLFNKKYPSGETVFQTKKKDNAVCSRSTGKAYNFARKKRWQILFWIRNLIWKIGRWESPQLKAFVDDFQPDLIFQPIYIKPYINDIALFLKDYTNCPMVGYISDDNYTLRQFRLSPLYWIDRLWSRRKVRAVIEKCEFFYVISDVQKRDYEKIFGIPCKVLTKSADFSGDPPVKTQYHDPMQIVFTGNIGTNRWKSLAVIARALQTVNQNGVRAQLRIYTATPLTKKMRTALAIDGTSFLMGPVPASEIPRIQSDADMLVHAEAFDRQNRLAVRQSFSTKLVDYFKAARPILAVGPRDVASIEHLIANDCALVAQTETELVEKLTPLIEDGDALTRLAARAYACGRAHHDKAQMDAMLSADLHAAARGEKIAH